MPLVELWIASWRDAMPGIDFDARRGWIAALLRDPARKVIVVLEQAEPAGFVSLQGGHLEQLVVAPSAKGNGMAALLLDAAKRVRPDGLTLDVNQDNARAVRFYRREGFVVAGPGVNPASGLATWAMRWRP